MERMKQGLRQLPKKIVFISVSLVCLVTLLGAGILHGVFSQNKTVITDGAARWLDDTTRTAPTFSISVPSGAQAPAVAPQFQSYYAAHTGAQTLGTPITPVFPVSQGWIQYFVSGALLLPSSQAASTDGIDPDLTALLRDGLIDQATNVVLLPLVQSLLTVGSLAQVAGAGSALTYADLRQAMQPASMVLAPLASKNAGASQQSAQGAMFVQGGTRNGQPLGHLVPAALWQYINRPDVSPDGWQRDVGEPLTEAIPFTMMVQGQAHHMLAQVFLREALLVDLDGSADSGQPVVQPVQSGLDYLRTLGPPAIVLGSHRTIWAQGDTTLLDAPGTGMATAHIGQQFPLKLLGDVTWDNGALWYHVQWSAPKNTGQGWAPAVGTTYGSPGAAPAWASFDVLSPDLAAYLASVGDNVNAVVYDETRQRYYTYNAGAQFIMGSSIKVPIMLTFLNMTESQGREPTDDEMNLLTTMIENSDNDSAATLYYDTEGGAPAVADYLQSIGVSGMDPDCCAFGYSLTTPLAMVNLLTLLHNGKILTADDRSLALSLMSQIESDQQVGVGASAPDGASWAMKDGWLPGPDDLWAMNSSGIITQGGETYIIAVYSQEQNSLEDAQAIVQQVCNEVASLLL
jgi:beta-lactamase class A